MASLTNYVKGMKDYRFDQVLFNEMDILALTEIAYLSYARFMSREDRLTLAQMAPLYREEMGYQSSILSVTNKARVELFFLMADSPRYQDLLVQKVVYELDEVAEKQFGAQIYDLGPDKHKLLVFRGTDENLIGWKEDFKMAFLETIPAQEAASLYLEEAMAEMEGSFILAGHSKGGNLAIYAASQAVARQMRISSIYTFDAPGLHKCLVESGKFLAIRDKIRAFVPQDSIVSLILENPVPTYRVHSKAFWFLQHDTFSWEINYLRFVAAPRAALISATRDRYLNEFLLRASSQELEAFFDFLFDLFLAADIHRFTDLNKLDYQQLVKFANNLKGISKDQAQLALRIFGLMVQAHLGTVKTFFPQGTSPAALETTQLPQKEKKGGLLARFPFSKKGKT